MKIRILWQKTLMILLLNRESIQCKKEQTFLSILFLKKTFLEMSRSLDVSKAIQENDIPVKIITANNNFFAGEICIKLSKISKYHTSFQKRRTCTKNNYRPVSILHVFSKIFERLLSRQLKVLR